MSDFPSGENLWTPDPEQMKTEQFRREMLRRPSGGGGFYREVETHYVPTTNPGDSETQKKLAWEQQQENLIAARPGHVYVTYEEHLEEVRLEEERREAEEEAKWERQEAADRRERQRREREAKRLSLALESITIRCFRETKKQTPENPAKKASTDREELLSLARRTIKFFQEEGEHFMAGRLAALIGDIATVRKELTYLEGRKDRFEAGYIAALIGDISTAKKVPAYSQKMIRGGRANGHTAKIAALVGDTQTARKCIAYWKEDGRLEFVGEIAALIGDISTARTALASHLQKHEEIFAGQIAAIIGDTQTAKECISRCQKEYSADSWAGLTYAGYIAGWLIWSMNRKNQ